MRLSPLLRSGVEPYRYEREVEEFLRWSPNVRNARPKVQAGAAPGLPAPPVDHYDALGAEEIISLLSSLERADLEALRDYEAGHRGRDDVIGAIESLLARSDPAG